MIVHFFQQRRKEVRQGLFSGGDGNGFLFREREIWKPTNLSAARPLVQRGRLALAASVLPNKDDQRKNTTHLEKIGLMPHEKNEDFTFTKGDTPHPGRGRGGTILLSSVLPGAMGRSFLGRESDDFLFATRKEGGEPTPCWSYIAEKATFSITTQTGRTAIHAVRLG